MISPDEAEDAVHELINTAEKLARLEGRVRDLERVVELEYARAYIRAKGSNIEERKANAKQDPEYQAADNQVTPAQIDFKTLLYRRKGLDDLIGLYRTQESSRRQGV